jgi:hypothetical protein
MDDYKINFNIVLGLISTYNVLNTVLRALKNTKICKEVPVLGDCDVYLGEER